MDCVLPGHAVKSFSSSIGCLSKIGKDVYIEFDPIEGLTIRSLNDAKSAYACFRFESSFFERCTAPPTSRKRTHSQSSDRHFSCRIAVRALVPVVRSRKDVVSLRILSEESDAAFFVSFEFHLQNKHNDLFRVVHRIKAADADAVSAVAPKEEASEITTQPKLFLRLLEPLKRTVEAALLIRKDSDLITACSFHHSESVGRGSSRNANTSVINNNAILQATHSSLLKTETSIAYNEFEEFFFRDNRPPAPENQKQPEDVNDGVVLVFPIKEAKAMLQYCAHAHPDPHSLVSVSFHWGGRPIVFESNSEFFSAELVLATLDYDLLS